MNNSRCRRRLFRKFFVKNCSCCMQGCRAGEIFNPLTALPPCKWKLPLPLLDLNYPVPLPALHHYGDKCMKKMDLQRRSSLKNLKKAMNFCRCIHIFRIISINICLFHVMNNSKWRMYLFRKYDFCHFNHIFRNTSVNPNFL